MMVASHPIVVLIFFLGHKSRFTSKRCPDITANKGAYREINVNLQYLQYASFVIGKKFRNADTENNHRENLISGERPQSLWFWTNWDFYSNDKY